MKKVLGRSVLSSVYLLLIVMIGIEDSMASDCRNIKTTLDGSVFPCAESPGGLCADGTIPNGILKGTKFAVYTAAAPSAGLPGVESPSVLSYTADVVFTTKRGELHLNQLGLTDPLRQVFTELTRVLGGTGIFDDATGDLFIFGTLSPDGTDFFSDIRGWLCLADSGDDEDDEDDEDED